MSVRVLWRTLFLGAVAILIAVGGAGLYVSAYVGELNRATLTPDAAPSIRASLLREVEESLGTRGAVGAYQRFVRTGDRQALTQALEHLATAEQVTDLYADQSATQTGAQAATALRGLIATFAGLYERARVEGNSPAVVAGLEQALVSLSSMTGALHGAEVMTRLDAASEAVESGRTAFLLTMLGIVAVVLAVAVIIRIRLLGPLEALTRDLNDVSEAAETGAALDTPLWGIDRTDEIGDAARAGDRLRAILAGENAFPQATDGALTVKLTGPAGQVLDQVLARLRDAASELADKGLALDKAREDGAAAAVETAARSAGVVDSLQELRQNMAELLADGRKGIGRVTGQLQEAASRLEQTEGGVRASSEKILTRLNSGANALKALATSTREHVSDAVSTMSVTQEQLAAVVERTGRANDEVFEAAQVMREDLTKAAETTRQDCAALTETVHAFDAKAQVSAGLMRDSSRYVNTATKQTLSRLGDMMQALTVAAPRLAELERAVSAGDLAKGEGAVALAAVMRDLSETVTARLRALDDLARRQGEALEGVEGHAGEMTAALARLQSGLETVLTRLPEDGPIPDGFERVAGGIATSLSHIAGRLGRAVDDQQMTQTALTRYHQETREALKTVATHLETMEETLSDRIIAPETLELEERLQDIGETLYVLSTRFDALLVQLQEDAEARADTDEGEPIVPLISALHTDMRARLEDVATRLRALAHLRGEETGNAVMLEDVARRIGLLSESIEGLAEDFADQSTSAPGAADAEPWRPMADILYDMGRHVVAVGSRVDDLAQDLRVGLAALAEASDKAADTPQDETRRIEALARLLFTRLTENRTPPAPQETDAVIGSLKSLIRTVKGAVLPSDQNQSLAGAARDVTALTDVIDALESRTQSLAEDVAQAPEADGRDAAVDIAALKVRLDQAREKLSGIATAIAVAADVQQSRRAS